MGRVSPGPSAVASSALPKVVLPRPARGVEWWIEPIKWAAIVVFLAIPVFAFLVQAYAGRVVWTVVVAALPLFIVLVGYHRWRRLCPLAFLAQLPARRRRPGTRRAGVWLEAHYNVVMLAVFGVALWLRLIATNGDGQALAVFFVLLSLAALTVGFLYTGKTWCNYICPVSVVEKIYTEPHGLRQTRNSQCVKCSACKKSCPDINTENGYWKEIESAPKRFVYGAFPGLVFGFYVYYYLQSGSWDYYFSGSWTNQARLFETAFLPGHDAHTAGFFFLPGLPRAVAASLTLAFCGLASVVVFSQIERLVRGWLSTRGSAPDPARARHVTNTLAAFSAFISFYSFAGAPTLRLVPWLHHLFLILVVGTATLSLVRRLGRTQQAFAEETLAKNIIKHWEWADVAPPKDLREAFLLHTIRARESKKSSAEILQVYKNAVRETLANGYVSRQEVHLLESLRDQLHIKTADHEQIMSELAEEERDLLSDPGRQLTAEKILQLESYARVLGGYLERVFAADGTPDDGFIEELRAAHHVTQEEHTAVLDKLLGGTGALASQLIAELKVVERTSHSSQVLAQAPMPACHFLVGLMQRRRERAVHRVLHLVGLGPEAGSSQPVREGLSSSHRARREAAVERLCTSLPKGTAEHLLSIYRDTAEREARLTALPEILRERTLSTNHYVRAVALHLLGELGAADETTRERLRHDEHAVVREAASVLDERLGEPEGAPLRKARLTTIEKVFAWGAVPMFSHLTLQGLSDLASASSEAAYDPGARLFLEGEHGDEVFIVVEGEVSILRGHGAGESVIGTAGVGEIIGEMAVLDPALRSATVRAGSRGARTLRLNGKAFREVIDVNPSIATGIIRMLAQRLRGTKSVDNPCFPA